MTQPSVVFKQYQPVGRIVLSGALAAMFGLRAVMSFAGLSSLSGPVWGVLHTAVCLLSLARCFDHVTVTPHGMTVFRMGFPRVIDPQRVQRLIALPRSRGRYSRIVAELVGGKQVLLAVEKNDAEGQRRGRWLWDNVHWLLGAHFATAVQSASGS